MGSSGKPGLIADIIECFRDKPYRVIAPVESHIKDILQLTKEYDSVVIATGSQAAPHLGGNQDGHNFAKEFGHTILPTYPSLVQLHLSSKLPKSMSGTKINGELTLFLNGQKKAKQKQVSQNKSSQKSLL